MRREGIRGRSDTGQRGTGEALAPRRATPVPCRSRCRLPFLRTRGESVGAVGMACAPRRHVQHLPGRVTSPFPPLEWFLLTRVYCPVAALALSCQPCRGWCGPEGRGELPGTGRGAGTAWGCAPHQEVSRHGECPLPLALAAPHRCPWGTEGSEPGRRTVSLWLCTASRAFLWRRHLCTRQRVAAESRSARVTCRHGRGGAAVP